MYLKSSFNCVLLEQPPPLQPSLEGAPVKPSVYVGKCSVGSELKLCKERLSTLMSKWSTFPGYTIKYLNAGGQKNSGEIT